MEKYNYRLPRNKTITIRVNSIEKLEYEYNAMNNGLSTSSWANLLLKKHKNSLEKENRTNRILEIMDDILSSLKETQDKIRYRENKEFQFTNEQVGLNLLKSKLLLRQDELRKIKRKLINLKTDND